MRRKQVKDAVDNHYQSTGQPARIQDLAEQTGISKSSCHRWAVKLARDGEIERTPSAHRSIRPTGK